jgi:hypothetical protein
MTIATVGAFTSSGGSWDFQVSGDVTSNDIAFTSANTRVSLVGNTDQQLLGGGELVNLDVSKTGGNVVLPANFVLVAGTLTGSGLIQNGGGSLVIGDGGSGYTLDFGGTIDDMVVNIANGSFVFLNQHLVVNNSMTITAVGAFSSSGGSWDFQVSGDVTSNDVSFTSANTRVSLVGNTDQQLLGGGELVNLDVSKTGGNVVLPANFVLDNGTLTGSGLIQNGGGSLVIGDGDSSYTLDFGGTIDDMVVNIGNGSFVFLNQHLVVNNNMTIISVGAINGSGSIRELQVSGDVIINDNGFTQSLSTIAMISGGLQNLTANVATSFGNLTVGAGTIAVETVSADNLSITTVTNNGIIRKSQTAAVGALDFGLTNVAMNVDSETGSPSITVDRIDSDHPNAAPGMVSSSDMYWDITATAGTFQVDITFNDPTVSTVSGDQRSCRTDDGGTNWDCQLDDDGDGTNSQVVRNDVTAFSAWQSCAGCGPTAISLSSTSLNVGNSWNQQLLLSFTALVLLSGLALFWFGRRRQLQ